MEEQVVLVINGTFSENQVFSSVKKAIAAAKRRYRNIVWQEQEDLIEVRNFVVDPNGYHRAGDTVLFKSGSSDFLWND